MTLTTAGHRSRVEPTLPEAQGPLSAAVCDVFAGRTSAVPAVPLADCDPYGLDLQLALYACYELPCRGFAGVAPEWEWDPELLRLRAGLERHFIAAVRDEVGEIGADES